ncbi:MAG TPA: thioredoxin domain-containing protein [Actinomadura sp.]|jgi:protein-disulfide isomerase|nr:thioredoxin domain-containing protein [Actinomadura sp.]
MNRGTRSDPRSRSRLTLRRGRGTITSALGVLLLASVGRETFTGGRRVPARVPAGGRLPTRIPAGANAEGDGIVVGQGPASVDVYVDFLCPFCAHFERTSGPLLRGMVAEGRISLVYHPMGFLDELSTTRYSSRASAASGCASDGGMFLPYAYELFAHQPPEGGPGLSDDRLIQLGDEVGLPEPDFARCVRNATYLDWAAYVTDRALARGVAATPTVFVQGVPVPANPHTVAAAVTAVTR